MLAAETTGEPAAADLERAEQQHDAQQQFRELQHRGKEGDVRQHESLGQPRKDAAVRAGIGADELVEILNVVRIGQLVEPRQDELDS